MEYAGNLRKMKAHLTDPIEYQMVIGEDLVDMNPLIGQNIKLSYNGQINCKVCGRKTKKSFGEGLCFPCFQNAPQNSPCIIRPELCEGHLGIGRDVAWEEANHVQPHVVYLALSSGVKVGVTRGEQVPTRWIDQGASQAIRLAETPYRQLAGAIEVALKEHLSDKTNWQRMLKNQVAEGVDLLQEKAKAKALLSEDLQQYISEKDDIFTLNYPVTAYPLKVSSVGFDKLPEIEGKLKGIKGQYLIFTDNRVLNIRKHTGYWVSMEH
ncbi:MAG: DUF2797 domain-containing protein [Chitinophagales bacterium]